MIRRPQGRLYPGDIMTAYVLIHGAWHSGDLLESTAELIRSAGHTAVAPTILGNGPGDPKSTSLAQAIGSITKFITNRNVRNLVLVGHSYGGMIITAVADQFPDLVRRLVYWNAFVPNNGESLLDMAPPDAVSLFEALRNESPDGSISLPFPVWRDAFFNDGDAIAAKKAFDRLNAQPYRTFADKISLSKNPSEMMIAKSYINATEDTALPQHYSWHPRLSQKLGFFRLVQMRGSHTICFSNPKLLAESIMMAGRD
jgi:pimeloyl-ACP methyl ester carboxylesterase